mgnify:CR=1 FL=1
MLNSISKRIGFLFFIFSIIYFGYNTYLHSQKRNKIYQWYLLPFTNEEIPKKISINKNNTFNNDYIYGFFSKRLEIKGKIKESILKEIIDNNYIILSYYTESKYGGLYPRTESRKNLGFVSKECLSIKNEKILKHPPYNKNTTRESITSWYSANFYYLGNEYIGDLPELYTYISKKYNIEYYKSEDINIKNKCNIIQHSNIYTKKGDVYYYSNSIYSFLKSNLFLYPFFIFIFSLFLFFELFNKLFFWIKNGNNK